jgi:hypothetical protein
MGVSRRLESLIDSNSEMIQEPRFNSPLRIGPNTYRCLLHHQLPQDHRYMGLVPWNECEAHCEQP